MSIHLFVLLNTFALARGSTSTQVADTCQPVETPLWPVCHAPWPPSGPEIQVGLLPSSPSPNLPMMSFYEQSKSYSTMQDYLTLELL